MKTTTTSGDAGKRSPMQWTAGTYGGFSSVSCWNYYGYGDYSNPYNVAYQLSDSSSLLNTYKNLIAIRKAYPALRRGAIKVIDNGSSSVLIYFDRALRHYPRVVNLTSSAQTANLTSPEAGFRRQRLHASSSEGRSFRTNQTSNNSSKYLRGTITPPIGMILNEEPFVKLYLVAI
jgi:glycosidase